MNRKDFLIILLIISCTVLANYYGMDKDSALVCMYAMLVIVSLQCWAATFLADLRRKQVEMLQQEILDLESTK